MSDYPTESPNDDIRGRLAVAALNVFCADYYRRKAREAEHAKRMDRVRIDSPPDDVEAYTVHQNRGLPPFEMRNS